MAAALRRGEVKAVRKALEPGAELHWSSVCEAIRGGHLGLAQMLDESGVKPNVFTMASLGDVARLKSRLGRAPANARLVASMEPAGERVTPLHVACASDWRSYGKERMEAQLLTVKILVESGADLNATARYRGIDGATPLFCACWSSGNLSLVRWLLDQGAWATEECLLAALGHFQRHDKAAYKIAEVLLDRGLSVNGGARGGRTPLQAFAHQGVRRTVEWLIAHGADVNLRGPGGRTAAHFAAERNSGPATLALLVENGIDLAARDEDGHTPMDVAKLNGKRRLVEWLRRKGARGG